MKFESPQILIPPSTALQSDSPDIHDRVADAYFGKLGTKFMRDTQQRIHWICGQAHGALVLDVGCSQGITAILLGREGKRVLGLDIDPTSVAEADALLANEPLQVRERVRFEQADFLGAGASEERYDTVIMAEVLEHLINAQAFVDAAAQCLRPGGQLVVTVPFGINDYIDHKRTYYLGEPYRLICERFEIIDVSLLGPWLGLVGRSRGSDGVALDSDVPSRLIPKLEAAFHQLERGLRDQLADVSQRLQDANAKYRQATEQIAGYRQKLEQAEVARITAISAANAKLQADNAAASADEASSHRSLELARVELTSAKNATAHLEGKLAAAVEAQHRTELELARSTVHLEHLRAGIDRLEKSASKAADAAAADLERSRVAASDATGAAIRAAEHAQLLHAELAAQAEQLRQAETSARLARHELEVLSQSAAAEREVAVKNALVVASELEHARVELGERLHELSALESATHTLHDELAHQREAQADAQMRLEMSLATAARLQSVLAAAWAERDRAVGELEGSQQQLRDIGTKLQTAAEANSRLAQARDEDRAERERLAREIADVGHSNAHLKADLDRLHSALATQNACQRDAASKAEQLNHQLLESQQQIRKLHARTEQLAQQKIAAENQIAKTRATFSFRLGYLLLHGFKSVGSAVQLPGQLLALQREGRKRRAARRSASTLPVAKRAATRLTRHGAAIAPAHATVQTPAPAPDASARLNFSATSAATSLKSLKVACIMDEFTLASFAPECNLLNLSVAHWRSELDRFVPDLLFIESAWRGRDEQWQSKVGHLSAELVGIVNWCREHGVATVFWNKEDPVHFETFLNTARLFDCVFTTDIDCIQRYKAALEHDRVYLLPFACQPTLSNPLETYERKDAFCFAGAYYVRYPERTSDLANFVSVLPQHRPLEIFDRNFGKDDPNYQFPPEYRSFIVGTLPFDQIDRAYKGYCYAINLNSIKQSQTMFARRVFELLASNTITVSNYSRGLRLMFGDLVLATDSGAEIVRRLKELTHDEVQLRKFRLAGLRKVMAAHTYQHRLAYVVSKVSGKPLGPLGPEVLVTAYARTREQLALLLNAFERQTYTASRLVVVVPNGSGFDMPTPQERVTLMEASKASELKLCDLADAGSLIAGLVPDDHYGAEYLHDLVLASRYSTARGFGKGRYYAIDKEGAPKLSGASVPYRAVTKLSARCSMLRVDLLGELPLRDWVTGLHTKYVEDDGLLCTDEFNYCMNVSRAATIPAALVDDLGELDAGIELRELLARAEAIKPAGHEADDTPLLSGANLHSCIHMPASLGYACELQGDSWQIQSTLGEGKHEYHYVSTDLRPAQLNFDQTARFHLSTSVGLNIQVVMLFLDAQKQRISHVVKQANRNHECDLPAGCEWIRLGLRIYGSGMAKVHGLVLGQRQLLPSEVVGRADHLLITNHYPSANDLYRNGFVHTRVSAYRRAGVAMDVFRLQDNEALSFHEHENIDVITGSAVALRKLLEAGTYRSVCVHFLDPRMWNVLKDFVDVLPICVWMHGSEVQPWQRRQYNYSSPQELDRAKQDSALRLDFWRSLLARGHANLKLVFVSRYFADTVMEDLGIRLDADRFEIVHNPINTDLFLHVPKRPEHRWQVLSVRPYSSRTYANDLTVQCILHLRNEPFFSKMQFRLIGDGKLFEETVAPVRNLPNVIIEQRFLPQREIAQLHRTYGIFLCPSRMDSQGVSRDEAMSSGLVPVTNSVAAIPEFVDEACGVLAAAEDAEAMAKGVAALVNDADLFLRMSAAAARRVRTQSSQSAVIKKELQLIRGFGPTPVQRQ